MQPKTILTDLLLGRPWRKKVNRLLTDVFIGFLEISDSAWQKHQKWQIEIKSFDRLVEYSTKRGRPNINCIQ